MTTETTKHAKHMTFNANVAFDLKSVVKVEMVEEIIKQLEAVKNVPEKFAELDTKQKVFVGLILEGKTTEERVARFLQFKLREALNGLLRDEMIGGNDENLRLSVSPVKFRYVTNG